MTTTTAEQPGLLEPHLVRLERRMRDLLDCQSERRAILLNVDQASGAATCASATNLASAPCAPVDRSIRISFLIAAANRFCEHVRDGLAQPADPVAMSSICLLIENADDLGKWASELIIETELARIGVQRGTSNPAGHGSAHDREAEVLQLTTAVRAIQAVEMAMDTSAAVPVVAPGEDAVTLPAPLYHASGRVTGAGASQQSSGWATRVQAS